MKKVLIVCPSDKLGGAEQILLNLVKYFAVKGFRVNIYFLLNQTNTYWQVHDNVTLHYTNNNRESKGLFSLLKNILLDKNKYNYTFSSHQHVNALLSILRFLGFIKTRKLIIRESTSVFKRFTYPKLFLNQILYFFYFKSSIDLIICQTNEMKEQLLSGVPKIRKMNCQVISNPIDLAKIKSSATSTILYDNFILAIGRLHPIKGFDKLIEAYSLSKEAQNHKLLILGEGTERLNLELLIHNLNLSDKVILVGQVNDVFSYIKKAKVGVITSVLEGFPNVLLQMYALNCKVVMTPCCGGLEIFPHLFLTKDMRVPSIVEKLEEALSNNECFNFDSFMEQYNLPNFFTKVLNGMKDE